MSRTLMAAVQAQQTVIDDQRKQLAVQAEQIQLIARLAGVSAEVDGIAKAADIANPAQPIPDPGEQGPSETTEQAATPETNDDVRSPGQTGNSTNGVPAAATDTALQPGGTLPAEPYGNLQDVTAPVSGTNTGEVGGEQTRIESDVRVGNPMVPDVAFPWTISDNQSNSGPPSAGEMSQSGKPAPTANRAYACMHLARLRIEAGVERGNDLTIAANLEADPAISDELIRHEIAVLTKLTSRTPAPGTGNPRIASARPRVAPSLASAPSMTGSAGDIDDSDIFLT
ncbi:hypothetical protein [Streptomyces sp. NPDC054838]